MSELPEVEGLAPAEIAKAWARAGFTVLPCSPNNKQPHWLLRGVSKGEGGYKLAARDSRQIAMWWDQAPDALIGVVPGSGEAVVIDVDGPDGRKAFWELAASHGFDRYTTPIVETPGKGGGLHIWLDRSEVDGIAGNRSIDGIGEQRGDRGYVIVDSPHPDGGWYRRNGKVRRLAQVPDWMLGNLLDFDGAGSVDSSGVTDEDVERWIESHTHLVDNDPGKIATSEALDTISDAAEGRRHPTLAKALGGFLNQIQRSEVKVDLPAALDRICTSYASLFSDEERQHRDVPVEFRDLVGNLIRKRIAEGPRAQRTKMPVLEPGGIVFDTPQAPVALWGESQEVIAAVGEPTIIYAPTGLGKTTIAQQLGIRAIGIGEPKLLGYPVRQIEGRVLYIAADRPSQAKRSLRRMVRSEDRAALDERWRFEVRRRIRLTPGDPELLYGTAREARASLVILDSIKDLVPLVTTDEGGQAYNDAVQICVANGIDVVALHHPRKATSEGRKNLGIDDVYGSTWVTAGAGSVVSLSGRAGEGVVAFRQLKMPSQEVGPFDISFDFQNGTVRAARRGNLLEFIHRQEGGATTRMCAEFFTEMAEPGSAAVRKVRRQLQRLEEDGYLWHEGGGTSQMVWYPKVGAGGTSSDHQATDGGDSEGATRDQG